MFDPSQSTAASPAVVNRIADKAIKAGAGQAIADIRSLNDALNAEVTRPIVLTVQQFRPFLDLFRSPENSRLSADARTELGKQWMRITDKYRPTTIIQSETNDTVVYTVPAQILPPPIVHTRGLDMARHEHQTVIKSQTVPEPVKDNALVAVGNEFLAAVAEDPNFAHLIEGYYQDWQRSNLALGRGDGAAIPDARAPAPAVLSDEMPVEAFD